MTKVQQELKIQTIKVSELIANEYNPRKWDEPAIEGLKESIQRFGLSLIHI